MENQIAGYSVDVVLCIETGGRVPDMDRVKERALAFCEDLQNEMISIGLSVDSLRVKVIGFRDYACQTDRGAGLSPMDVSPFFELPAQNSGFQSFVKGLRAEGGGDLPGSGYEALALAINSEWELTGRNRQVIVLWTDTNSHPLGHGSDHPDYPKSMPEDFAGLTDWWESKMDKKAKRLLLFAPDCDSWSAITNHWKEVIMCTSNLGEGLEECDYKTILSIIADPEYDNI